MVLDHCGFDFKLFTVYFVYIPSKSPKDSVINLALPINSQLQGLRHMSKLISGFCSLRACQNLMYKHAHTCILKNVSTVGDS